MAKVIKQQYGQKTGSGSLDIFHFETDSDMVLIEGRGTTLTQELNTLLQKRTFTLTGDVTGTVEAAGSANVIISTEVGDDSHTHTGATIQVGEGGRVVVTAADKSIIVSEVTATELGYLAGVTSGIQAQLNGKAASNHDHDTVYLKQGLLGTNGGVAPLGADGKIASQYLPGYLDDVIEGTVNAAFTEFTETGATEPCTPMSGKIYNDIDKNKSYRWTGTKYQALNDGVALGETESTAYRGDRGAAAYAHSQATHARVDATKTANSTKNGYIEIDGTEVVVYSHPSVTVSAGTATQTLTRGGNFAAISALTVDASGHLTGKTTKTYTMPAIPNIQFGGTQPTNQIAGDLWFESLT